MPIQPVMLQITALNIWVSLQGRYPSKYMRRKSSDSVTINGQHGSGVVYLMDGGSNNDDLRGGSSGAQARPPLEAIQEFQVVTNQFDAEYGAMVWRASSDCTEPMFTILPEPRSTIAPEIGLDT